MFKRVAIPMAAAAVLMTSHAARAADFSPPVLRGSEVIAPVEDYGDRWSGFYVGGHLGGQFIRNTGFHSDRTNGTRNDRTGLADGTGTQVYDFDYDYGKMTLNYGLHVGFQRLFGAFLLGAELSLDGPVGKVVSPWYNGNVAFTDNLAGGNRFQQRVGLNWQGSAVLRAGYAHHKTLYYALGGFAFASTTVCTVLNDCNNPLGHIVKYTAMRYGWTVGAGMEHRLTHNWSIRAEYRYTNYGSRTCLADAPCSINANSSDIRNQIDTHTVRVGVSYLFGAPPAPIAAPVIARY